MVSRFEMVKKRHCVAFENALKQGKVDPQIESLCSFVNSTKNFFTSSSCSGRILLIEKVGARKIDNFFHRKWHRLIKLDELEEGVNAETQGELWFRVDPFILHLGCADLASAKVALAAMKRAGVKRGGILVAEDGKFLLEFQGTSVMSFPVKFQDKVLVNGVFLEFVLDRANKLLSDNYKRLSLLELEFRKSLF